MENRFETGFQQTVSQKVDVNIPTIDWFRLFVQW